jgi:hypothetical protein
MRVKLVFCGDRCGADGGLERPGKNKSADARIRDLAQWEFQASRLVVRTVILSGII